MIAFIWTMITLSAFGVLLKLIHLGRGEYPRKESDTSALIDALSLLINLGLGLWAYSLLP